MRSFAADLLESSLPNIWKELQLPGTPFPQSTPLSRRDVEASYEILDRALRHGRAARCSDSPSLDAWLRHAGEARPCLQGVMVGARLGSGPHFVAHPSPRFALNAYMAELLERRVTTVVALDKAPWWQGIQKFGSVSVTQLHRQNHLLGRASAPLKVSEATYALQRGNDRHEINVVQIPWKDFGVPPPTALAQSIGLANARTGAGVMAVHCGAGIGRTGTFISTAHLLRERSEGTQLFGLHGQAVLAFLWTRMHREGAIETPEQFAVTLRAALSIETN